jgi:hypothetical protein
MKNCAKLTLLFLFALGVCPYLGRAQRLSPAGVVTVASNATIGNGAVSEGATVFSGDLLKTGDQGHLSLQSGTVQLVLGENSSARVFKNLNRILVEIERGTLVYTTKGANEDLMLFALDIRIVPKTGVPAAGQISIVSRCDVSVTAVRSTIDVTSGREAKTIEETKSFRVFSDVGVDYRDSWQPVLTDYPDYPRDAEYHRSHSHVACAAAPYQAPISALGQGHFREIAMGIAVLIGIPPIIKALESPDRP